MVFDYVKLSFIYHSNRGTCIKPYTISKLLEDEEGIEVSKVGVMKYLKVYLETGSTARRPGSGQTCKVTQDNSNSVAQDTARQWN